MGEAWSCAIVVLARERHYLISMEQRDGCTCCTTTYDDDDLTHNDIARRHDWSLLIYDQ